MNRVRKVAAILACRFYLNALLRHRVAAGVEHEAVFSGQNWRTVVDVGASRGQFALAARRCRPRAKIHAFEPLPEPAAVLRRVFAGDKRAKIYETAVGPVRGDATIHISQRDEASSLLPITPAQAALFPGTGEVSTAVVFAAPLREFVSEDGVEPPALLKLDVQGFELEALRGCEDLLHRFGHVYADCSFVKLYDGQPPADEVIVWLRERGFRVWGVHNAVYDRRGRAVHADFLFGR